MDMSVECPEGCRICRGSILLRDVTLSASVVPGSYVGAYATMGTRVAVLTQVPDGETWVGVPARKIDRQAFRFERGQ